jgi:hypothetical protein
MFRTGVLADALRRVKRRNVTIVGNAEKIQTHECYIQIKAIKQSGVLMYIDCKPSIAHQNKFDY